MHTDTHAHRQPHAQSMLQSTLASGVWRRASQHAAYACSSSSSNNKHKRVALSWPCSKWLHKAQYAKSYRSLVLLLCFSSFCCFCCFFWHVNRQRYRYAVVLLLEFFEDFTYFILFLHLFTSRHPHTLSSKCMTRGTASERECE